MLLKLTLNGYSPLKLKGVNHITLHTKSIFNILLGRNGYGKTSILREISPLPADNADYDEDGYKEIEYSINKNHFLLISKTGKKSQHYFYLNGKNLNPGMTLMVQRELVKIHFRVTPDIKAVISGIDKGDLFTALSPQRRKHVLMEINPNDVSYALLVYEKIRLEYNQAKGALKHQRQRLATELKRQEDIKLMSVEELTQEVKYLDGQIKDALILHGSLQHIEEPDLTPLITKMDHLMIDILGGNNSHYLPISYYQEMILRTEIFLNNDNKLKIKLETLILDITNKINNIIPSADFTLQGYEEKIALLTIEIAEIQKNKANILSVLSRENFFQLADWNHPHFIMEINEFIEHLIHVEVTPDKEINSPLFLQLIQKQKTLETEIKVLEKEIEKANHQLNHYKQTEDIECPQCETKFKLGFEKFNPTQLEEFLTQAIENKEKKFSQLQKVKHRIEINEQWFYTMSSFMRFVKHAKSSNYIMEIIKYYDVGKVKHPKLTNLLKMMTKYHELSFDEENKITEQKTLTSYYSLMNENDIKQLYLNIENLSIELGVVQRSIKRRLADLAAWNKQIDQIKSNQLSREIYIDYFHQLEALLVQKGEWIIKNAVNERINDLTPRKDALVVKLMRAESINSIIHSIQEQVDELEKREKHLLFLMNSLSPTKGYIGFLMLDFLKSLCGNVNAIIERVWTDPLCLQSPNIDEDNSDLDYKFRVITTNPKKPASDIKKCSGGESSIIDFAMRFILLRYLGARSGLPLCMDEVGATFDELHRQNFSHFISTENRLGKLPQTFMISHYVSQYAAFKAEDVNIFALNSEGLTMPKLYNKNIIIK